MPVPVLKRIFTQDRNLQAIQDNVQAALTSLAASNSGITRVVSSKLTNATYTVKSTDQVLLVDASSAAVTIILLLSATSSGLLRIKKTDASSNSVIVVPNPSKSTLSGITQSDAIDGQSRVSLSSQYQQLAMLPDGSFSWDIASSYSANSAPSGIPSGGMIDWGANVAPSGWLLCDGSSYSTSQYPALFAAIGYTFGGSGSTFNVPDRRGRVAVGTGQGSGLTNRVLGATGGEETHILTGAESGTPVHGHGITDPQHGHSVMGDANGSDAVVGIDAGAASDNGVYTNGTNGLPLIQHSSTGISVNNATAASAASAHNNMQPFLVATAIIKT